MIVKGLNVRELQFDWEICILASTRSGRALAIHKTRVYYLRSFGGLGKRSGPACDNARANDFIAL